MILYTIADMAGCDDIQSVHLAEALQYHPRLILNQILLYLAREQGTVLTVVRDRH